MQIFFELSEVSDMNNEKWKKIVAAYENKYPNDPFRVAMGLYLTCDGTCSWCIRESSGCIAKERTDEQITKDLEWWTAKAASHTKYMVDVLGIDRKGLHWYSKEK